MRVSRTFWFWASGLLIFAALFLIMYVLTLNMGGIWSLCVNPLIVFLAVSYVIAVPVLAEQQRNAASSIVSDTGAIDIQRRIFRESKPMLVGIVPVLALMWFFNGSMALQLLVAALYLTVLGVWSWRRLFSTASSLQRDNVAGTGK
ncbi:MAG: hypothetical protein QOH93_3465 [Chloroflexia bacterium]|jgi:hypothetical protein|nr:hypothetical protein [Chloroflexia bacterium]